MNQVNENNISVPSNLSLKAYRLPSATATATVTATVTATATATATATIKKRSRDHELFGSEYWTNYWKLSVDDRNKLSVYFYHEKRYRWSKYRWNTGPYEPSKRRTHYHDVDADYVYF